MRLADAPAPGWYPDPTGRGRVRWWDGRDWTDHRRPAPPADSHGWVPATSPGREEVHASADVGRDESLTSSQRRARRAAAHAAASAQSRSDGATGDDPVEMVALARRVAREEVDRAVKDATQRFEQARGDLLPRLEVYGRRLRRWARIAGVVVVLLVALSLFLQASFQTSLLQWLGERVDALLGGATPGALALVPGVPRPGRHGNGQRSASSQSRRSGGRPSRWHSSCTTPRSPDSKPTTDPAM